MRYEPHRMGFRPKKHDHHRRRELRWSRPITSGRERFRAWIDLLFADHGVLRLFYLNSHALGPDLWRMAQPAPHDLTRYVQKYGLRTIINLRGGKSHGAWQLERDAAERLNLTILDLVLRSREAPCRKMLLSLPEFFQNLQGPAIVHCKSGADRAGLFSALYLLVAQNASADTALAQLSLRYGHSRFAKTGILDAFILAYRDAGEAKGKSFIDWVREDYDPEHLTKTFKPHALMSYLVDQILNRE
jgi:protein tyrosine/serine phosphatase